MTSSNYTSYHAFYWWFAKRKFIKSILAAGGEVVNESKQKGHYLVKVNNPNNNMRNHPNWYDSNCKYWRSSFIPF